MTRIRPPLGNPSPLAVAFDPYHPLVILKFQVHQEVGTTVAVPGVMTGRRRALSVVRGQSQGQGRDQGHEAVPGQLRHETQDGRQNSVAIASTETGGTCLRHFDCEIFE